MKLIIATLLAFSITSSINAQGVPDAKKDKSPVACPKPYFKIGLSGHSRFPAFELRQAKKAEIWDYNSATVYQLKEFSITLLFENGTYQTVNNKGDILTEATIQLMQKAMAGTRVFVEGIIATDDKGNEMNIPPRGMTLM